MKKGKKLLGVLLALTLLLALSVPALAAGTITVADPGTATYTAYKIFDATDDGTDVTYTLDAASEWKDVLLNADGSSNFPGLTFEGSGPYTVKKGNTFSAADFADFLRGASDANLAGKTGIPFSGDPLSATVDPGYYLVISSAASSNQEKAALTTVLNGKNVQIQNKNDMPFDKEIVEGTDEMKEKGVQIGDTVNYKIEGKVPALDPSWTTYIYLVSDTMDAGLTPKNDVVVEIGGAAVSLETITDPSAILTGNQIRYGENGKTFELSLDLIHKTADDAIVITYSAVVNENAAGTVTENKAVLEYGHDPKNLTIKDSETKVYTSKLIVDKFETGAPEQKLSGAEFVLYKVEGGVNKYYRYNTDSKELIWVTTADANVAANAKENIVAADPAVKITKVVTDSNGAANFAGLKDGTYFLKEIKAPVGYVLLAAPIPIEIDGGKATAVGLTDDQIVLALTQVANVNNTPGTNLPSTGGIGTTIFYVVGGILMATAAVALIAKKRMNAEA